MVNKPSRAAVLAKIKPAKARKPRKSVTDENARIPDLLRPTSLAISTRLKKDLRPVIGSSILRPPVPAADRLTSWLSPFGISDVGFSGTSLPSSQIDHLKATLHGSIVPKTAGNYAAGIARFHEYCDKFNIPEVERYPASDVLLAAFVSSWCGQISDKTVDGWLSGIRKHHDYMGAPWKGDFLLATVLQTIEKQVLTTSRRPPRPPASYAHIEALAKDLDFTSNCFEAAVFAIACVAFWGICRLGELTIPSINTFDPQFHASRSSPLDRRTLENGTRYLVWHIPFDKVKREHGADINLTARPSTIICPVFAMENHLRVNSVGIPPGAHFFSFRTNSGWKPMPKSWFLDRCNAVWKARGLESLFGHSFRIGGATEMLLLGIPPDVVMVQGRWTSRAFMEYWRRSHEILPRYIAMNSTRRYLLNPDTMITSFRAFRLHHNI
jgi:hypothetical protein